MVPKHTRGTVCVQPKHRLNNVQLQMNLSDRKICSHFDIGSPVC